MGTEFVRKNYNACIRSIETVYDGDTIEKVEFRLPHVVPVTTPEANAGAFGEIYPGLFLHPDGLWVHISVRLAGIDTPERHPWHHYPDGTPRPILDITREHNLAMDARAEVVKLLQQSDLQFELRNPEFGKYAGRIVAEVWVHHSGSGKDINVAEHLIEKGLGYPYEGGKKRIWGSNKDNHENENKEPLL